MGRYGARLGDELQLHGGWVLGEHLDRLLAPTRRLLAVNLEDGVALGQQPARRRRAVVLELGDDDLLPELRDGHAQLAREHHRQLA